MSDKLQEDFDIYYAEADNFNKGYNSRKHEVETNKLLSRAGKSEKVGKLEAEHFKNVNDLGERFNGEFGGRLTKIDDYVNDRRPDPVLESIEKRFIKGETLSTDETNKLLISEMRENKLLLRKSAFQNMLSNSDSKQIRKTAQSLNDNQDIERLGWLQELASFRGDDMLSNSLEAQLNGVRDSTLSEEKKNLQEVAKKIEKGVRLFNYTLERLKTGVFVDARNDEVK